VRLRISLLVVAISSLVLVSFLVPLALVLRTLAADRAVSAATAEAQSLAPLVTTLTTSNLRLTVDQVNAETSTPVTVFLPSGTELGRPAPVSPAVRLARNGRSFSAEAPRGEQVLVAVEGLAEGPAVIRAFVPDSVLRHGVAGAWLLLGGVGLLLLLLSVVVADQLARSLVRPVTALAQAADRLAGGELSARAAVAGPPEVRRAGAGLNRLAVRIGELLAHERETVADLSHRLRTPLTALRIDAESLRDGAEMERLLSDVGAVERTVSEIIREARRPGAGSTPVMCDAARVVAERAAFWRPLAEDQDRRMTVEVVPPPVPVLVAADELATCTDILLGNVFAHTPEGVGFAVRLSRRAAGGAWLVVADNGPGFREAGPPPRGQSRGGSTGLGLDIARRIAEASGGTLTIGRSASGGGAVTLGLGFPAGPPEESWRHRRARLWRRTLPRRAEQRGAPRAPVLAPEQGDGPDGVLPQP
jgi:signal transduction histidine kinase